MAAVAELRPKFQPDRVEFLKSAAPDLTPILDAVHSQKPGEPVTNGSTDQWKAEQWKKVQVANTIADLSENDAVLTRCLISDPDILSLRDIANKYSTQKLGEILEHEEAAENAAVRSLTSSTGSGMVPPKVLAFQRKVFHREPSATVARMIRDDEIHIGSVSHASSGEGAVASASSNPIKDGVVQFFDSNPDFNIREKGVLSAVRDPKTLEKVPEQDRAGVLTTLELIQRTAALSHTPDAITGLINSRLTSAHTVSQIPAANFAQDFAGQLGGEQNAKDIHAHATNVVIRNDLALTSLLQITRGSGLAAIDGPETRIQRIERAKSSAEGLPDPIDLEALFGTLDTCACDDCSSVTSPAAYFVELLQYLRNNNLDKDNSATGKPGFQGTPLEVLLRRRPDLADLDLTCANTKTVMPYIDLANEVMESLVVNMEVFAASSGHQITLEVFNAEPDKEGLGGSQQELLAQPQNTNDRAYCILKNAVYPSTKLPFHQPVEAIRLFLEFLQTNRAELGLVFRRPYKPPTIIIPDPSDACVPSSQSSCTSGSEDSGSDSDCNESSNKGSQLIKNKQGSSCGTDSSSARNTARPISAECQGRLAILHDLALSRSDDAERLLLTEEEYIILTKEAFWVKEYFDIRYGIATDLTVYQQNIGVRPDHEYWGIDYLSAEDMLDTNETDKKGLTFVKAQFLQRSGITYSELVDLLRTDFINPNMPKGRDRVIMSSIRLTYRYLQRLVKEPTDECHHHKLDKYKCLVDFLLGPQWQQFLSYLGITDITSMFDDHGIEDEVECARFSRACNSCCLPGIHHKPSLSSYTNRSKSFHSCRCDCHRRYKMLTWFARNFGKIGKIIVLDSTSQIRSPQPRANLVDSKVGTVLGHVLDDGTIVDKIDGDSKTVGEVRIDGTVFAVGDASDSEVDWYQKYGLTNVVVDSVKKGEIVEESTPVRGHEFIIPVAGIDLIDDCDTGRDRLKHLDGTCLTTQEYDRIHRFIRLWRKLGCSMIELDVALQVLGVPKPPSPSPTTPGTPPSSDTPSVPPTDEEEDDDVDWADFNDGCEDGQCGKQSCCRCKPKKTPSSTRSPCCRKIKCPCGSHHHHHHCHRHHEERCCERAECPSCTSSGSRRKHRGRKKAKTPDITADFLHQLVAVKKLADLTGLTWIKLLSFWGPIATSGSPSLYKQLFLTHNLLGLDQVFQPDADGNYLTASPPEQVSAHVPILMAAFGLTRIGLASLLKSLFGDNSPTLTLENVSLIYRCVLLSRVLGTKPDMLIGEKNAFGTFSLNPFESASRAVELVELWNKVSDAGFTFQQLRYVLTGEDDTLQPVGISKRSILQVAMSLYTGLNDIDNQHQDIKTEDASTSAVVLANASLLYSPDVAAQIVGFVDGTWTIPVRAPRGLIIAIPKEDQVLSKKLKYADGEVATLQSTGLLTEEETARAKRLSAHPQWARTVDRLVKFAATFLSKTLAGVFPSEPEEEEAKKILLVGDIIPADTDADADIVATAPKKRLFFLSCFIPFLRRKLADKLVIDTVASSTSLEPTTASALLSNVINVNSNSSSPASQTSVTAMEALQSIKNEAASGTGFSGYLIPNTSDTYTLAVSDEQRTSQPPDIMIDSFPIAFPIHTDDDEPDYRWSTHPLPLVGGRLYSIQLKEGVDPKHLVWKTDRSAFVPIPPSSILGDHIKNAAANIIILIFKCAIIISGFSFTSDEVLYLQRNSSDFGNPDLPPNSDPENFDWNKLTLPQWKRLADYSKLRSSLPKLAIPLIDLFKKMSAPESAKEDQESIAKQISEYTLWDQDDVSTLIDERNFNLAKAEHFRNERGLLKIQVALGIHNKVNVDIDLLFKWAQPRIDFWRMRDIRDSIRIAIRAQMKLSDWEVAIKPAYDKLRQMQSDALTAYLLNHPTLKTQRAVAIVDADSLFELLLIDNQMCPCMETARLKQATSSVQLFVQRCMLGLEPEVDVNLLDRERWNWMQRYRVWEANRKVFLWPENWIQPSLRDDKSPIFLQLESELLQKDLDKSSVMDTLKSFLFNLEDIANLEVDAIYVDKPADKKTARTDKVHFFARSRGSPYKFYYRTYNLKEQVWQPWQDMAVDVPRYEVEKPMKNDGSTGGPTSLSPILGKSGGFYLAPFVFNNRLLVAIPHFSKIQLPAPVPNQKMSDIGNTMNADESTPDEMWEIKMGITELRNGRWTPKHITSEAIIEHSGRTPPPIGSYKFVSRQGEGVVFIDIYRLDLDPTTADPQSEGSVTAVGRFTFTGLHFGVDRSGADDTIEDFMKWSDFHFQGQKPDPPGSTPSDTGNRYMYPLQRNATGAPEYEQEAYVKYAFDDSLGTSHVRYGGKPKEELFYHPFAHNLMDTAWRTDNLDDLFSYFATLTGEMKDDAFGKHQNSLTSGSEHNELKRPYSLYNWELGFHAPLAIADRLLQNQQFDLALSMMHFIFDPLTKPQFPVTNRDPRRCWKWPPFRDINAVEESIQNLFSSLEPNEPADPTGEISQWREHPFNPHLLARLRPVAYMKYVVVKYINILIAYGDYYFRQNTLEMIPMAIQCYILASHLYGKAPQKLPPRGTKKVQTYRTLLDRWDAFSNALVQMEVLFPFSMNQAPGTVGVIGGEIITANIFGLATAQYFCIPDNPDLRAVRDLIDDRLFKIRHCQDIKGVERKLPLYEPAIDPGLLVAAQAAGLSLSSVLNDLNSPLPNFRFRPLLKKAIEMCDRLREFGTALLAAKERKDCEAMLKLKQSQETVLHEVVMDQKKLNLDESNKAVEGLQQSRKAPEFRMKQTMQQLGEDLSSIPTLGDVESEFKELTSQIEVPLVESGLKLIAAEKEEIKKFTESLNLQPIINSFEAIAGEFHALPILNTHASPFGVGMATCFGFPNVARAMQGAAKAYKAVSDFVGQSSAMIQKMQGFKKNNTERVKEVNSTGHEIKTIDKQIVTHQVRVAVHEADITAQEKSIAHSQELKEFLTSKYTNAELYTWVDQELSNLYYRAYTATYDLARKAEAAFRYERGFSTSSTPPQYIKFGYWEPQNSGFLCGDRLLLSLQELEAAYQETRGHDFEITKHVSLRSVNPLELLRLRGDAIAEFAIPEILFDLDFPGQYARRLKNVSVSILPNKGTEFSAFDNFNCTLRLTSHRFRKTGMAQSKADYPEKTDSDDERFSSPSHVPIEAIATSSALQDSGVFELSFSETTERFLPFEGAGAISKWRLQLNEAFRSFDYDSIADVILTLKYTSLDGGRKLRDVAIDTVKDYIKSVEDLGEAEGLYGVLDIPRDFPTEWAAATGTSSGSDEPATHRLNLNALNTKLPAYTKGYSADNIRTRDVWVITDKALPPGDVSVRQGSNVLSFSRSDSTVGKGDMAMTAIHSTGVSATMRDWVVAVGDAIVGVKEMWIVVRYSLKPSS